MTRLIDEAEVRKMIRHACKEAGSQTALAQSLGVSKAFISDIVRGNREPSGKVLEHLGLTKESRRVTVYYATTSRPGAGEE